MQTAPRVIIVMGVSGAGKTTVGRALAAALDWPFVEGDDYHPASNVEKMRHGIPLTDADRAPWLARLREVIEETLARDGHAVIACSALRASYRRELEPPDAPEGAVRFVQLDVPKQVLHERLVHRSGHYMPPTLLDSQLATLEWPKEALAVDGTLPPATIVRRIRDALGV